MKRNLILALCFLIFPTSVFAAPKLTFKDHGKSVKELSLDEISKLVPPLKVEVADALEKETVAYEGYPIKLLIEKIYGKNKAPAEEILFTCVDGYQPSVPLKQFDEREAYLVYKRLDSPNFSITNKLEGNKKINVAPFYLVWEKRDPSLAHEENSWPYQVATLDLVNFADAFPKLAPPSHSGNKVIRGFLAFRNNCAGCHTLNGEGGKGGPELNYPANITEYYKEDWLKKWISDPTSIRFKTGMPGLDKNMPGREAVIEDIISYFKAMAKNKIKP